MTGSEFEVGPEFRLQTLLEIGMVDKKEVGLAGVCTTSLNWWTAVDYWYSIVFAVQMETGQGFVFFTFFTGNHWRSSSRAGVCAGSGGTMPSVSAEIGGFLLPVVLAGNTNIKCQVYLHLAPVS